MEQPTLMQLRSQIADLSNNIKELQQIYNCKNPLVSFQAIGADCNTQNPFFHITVLQGENGVSLFKEFVNSYATNIIAKNLELKRLLHKREEQEDIKGGSR